MSDMERRDDDAPPHCIANGLEVVPWARANAPDLILLDLMLPGRDGLDICRELRMFSDVPIVIVTARNTGSTQVGREIMAQASRTD